MSNDDNDLSKITFDFSKFVKEETKREQEKPKIDLKEMDENPNKEYIKRYYDNGLDCMWINGDGVKRPPRYR